MTGDLILRPEDRVLVLAPHPDDETLGAGGLIQRVVASGAFLHVAYATVGENNPWAQRAFERRLRIGAADRERFGMRRFGEARDALAQLGAGHAPVELLGFADQEMRSFLLAEPDVATRRVSDVLRRVAPTIVVAPSREDDHPDHGALAVVTSLALSHVSHEGLTPRVLRFGIHGERPAFGGAGTVSLVLSDEERACKRAAIERHATQLVLSRRRFLAFARSTESFLEDGPRVRPGVRAMIVSATRIGFGVRLALAHPPFIMSPASLIHLLAGSGRSCIARATVEVPHPFEARPDRGAADRAAGLRSVDVPIAGIEEATRIFSTIARVSRLARRRAWQELAIG